MVIWKSSGSFLLAVLKTINCNFDALIRSCFSQTSLVCWCAVVSLLTTSSGLQCDLDSVTSSANCMVGEEC